MDSRESAYTVGALRNGRRTSKHQMYYTVGVKQWQVCGPKTSYRVAGDFGSIHRYSNRTKIDLSENNSSQKHS